LKFARHSLTFMTNGGTAKKVAGRGFKRMRRRHDGGHGF
jgi:hypothetical protein